MCSLSRRQHECTACDGAVAMAMLFSEQQPKQVHKAHFQQSMCQAMELVEHASTGALPQPGAFPDPRKPLQGFHKQPGCSQVCSSSSPQEMCPGDGAHAWQTPGAGLPSARAAAPAPAHRGVRHRGPPRALREQSSCPHCASPTVPPAQGRAGWIPLARGGAGGRKAQLRFPRGV